MSADFDGCERTSLPGGRHAYLYSKPIHTFENNRILYVLKHVLIPTDWAAKELCIWPDQENRQLNQIN